MNARTRIMADARSLFLPWCIVTAAGILSLFDFPRMPGGWLLDETAAGLGFCVGLPLLAALSFGNEFQFGTFSSLLSQPVERSRIWKEKSAVIVIAVLSAAIAYGFGAHGMGWPLRGIVAAALWLMVTVSASTYWTLVAGSTIGGLVINGLQSMVLVLVFGPMLNRIEPYRIRGAELQVLLAIGVFATAYTAVMFYLGRRKLLRFQVNGAGPGLDVLATDWVVTFNPLRQLLCCTASGGVLNLVRKELHLLWPLAPLTLIALGILLPVVPLHQFAFGDQSKVVGVGLSIVLLHGLFASVLAAALSLGEERSMGLHAWNMTQPVSVFRQWLIKLMTVTCAGAACSGAVVLMAHLLIGPDLLQQFSAMFGGSPGMLSLAIFPLLTFLAFWCATGVNGTVRAAFWCLPAAGAVLAAYDFGMSTAMGNSAVEVVRALTAAVHPFPFSSEFEVMAYKLMWSKQSVAVPALWVTVWLLPFAAIQSYRLFRTDLRQGMMPLFRQVLSLAAIGFLVGLLQIVPATAQGTMHQNSVKALMEISRGVTAMQIDPALVSSETGYTVPLKTISTFGANLFRTRGWFGTDTVVIWPKSSIARDNGYELMKETRYMITAELHGGWKCAFADNLFVDRYGEGANRIPRGANYLFVCSSKDGKLGWLELIP